MAMIINCCCRWRCRGQQALAAEGLTVAADAGYANGEQGQACAEAGITVVVPRSSPSRTFISPGCSCRVADTLAFRYLFIHYPLAGQSSSIYPGTSLVALPANST